MVVPLAAAAAALVMCAATRDAKRRFLYPLAARWVVSFDGWELPSDVERCCIIYTSCSNYYSSSIIIVVL